MIGWLRRRNREQAERTSPLLGILNGVLFGIAALSCVVDAVFADRPWYIPIVVLLAFVSFVWLRRGLRART